MASAVYPSSCEPCRRRKSRCNRIKPCANCELRGISDECYVKAPRIEARKAQARNASRASSRSTGQTAAQHPVRSEGAQVYQTASDDGAGPSSSSSIPAPLTDLPRTTWTTSIQPLQHGKVGIGCSSDARDGGIHAKHLRLEDVSQYLPSVSLCDKFLRFFFDELVATVSFIRAPDFLDLSESFLQGQCSLGRQKVALLFWILSYSSLVAPPKHSLHSTFIDLGKSALQWRDVALSLQAAARQGSMEEDPLLSIALCVLEAMWGTYQSDFDACWEATGAGIRKAAALHLFKASGGRPAADQRGSLVVTSHLVQKLLVMDRWIAFTDLRSLGIHPTDVAMVLPEDGINTRASIERVQIRLLESARSILVLHEDGHTAREDLFPQLTALLQTIDTECSQAIAQYHAETPVKLDPESCVEGASAPHAAVLLSWLAACAFIGCSAAMRFSTNADTPLDVRLASFHWANNLMALVPSLTALHLHGKKALRLSRISNHLFYALRAVFLALSGSDLLTASGTDAVILGSSSWAQSIRLDEPLLPQTATRPLSGSDLDLTLLGERFRASVQLLRHFAAAKCRTASRALNLVNSVLARSSVLSTRLGTSCVDTCHAADTSSLDGRARRDEGAAGWQDRSEVESGPLALSAVDLDSNVGHTHDFMSSWDDIPVHDMIWQTPDLDVLNSHDIEAFLARFGDPAC